MEYNRRKFIKKTALTTTGIGAFTILPSTVWANNNAPSDKVNVAIIGCRAKGFAILKFFLDKSEVNCTAMCDVDRKLLEGKAQEIIIKYNQKPKLYSDFRKMLERKDIDAVIIGTPDHWHCLNMVYALQAGKDVYVEKPLGNSIEECNIMVRAAKRYNKQIVTVGQQQRSGEIFTKTLELCREELGDVRKVNIWAYFPYGLGKEPVADSAVPEGVDYNMWLGPAKERPFNKNRFHGGWRHFWDYGSGMASDWGVHLIDIGLWIEDDQKGPDKTLVYADNTFNGKRDRDTFDTMNICFPKKNFSINYDVTAGLHKGPWKMQYGIHIVGENGSIVLDRDRLEVIPEWDGKKDLMEAMVFDKGTDSTPDHVRNFLDCIKTRNTPACTPEMGRASALHMHIANIAGRVNEPVLHWDDENNRFTNSEAANQLITPEYREPWTLPAI